MPVITTARVGIIKDTLDATTGKYPRAARARYLLK